MRAVTIFTVTIVLAACLLKSTEAVTCTADPTVTGCIDCTDTANASNAECVAEAAAGTTSTEAVTTTSTTESTTTTTTTASPTSSIGGNRKIVRVSNLTYTARRRIRVGSTTASTTSRRGNVNRRSANANRNRRNVNRRNGNNARRGNVRGRNGNARVRVVVG
ncbi:hypothetical protein KR200_005183 [Drosophila serrata]|nr:hypothetical protein KR200_002355 [Drosophila serrata]KAH8394030.1 hypothetical protein KR200_005183 [Drosophila serrata]